MLNGSNANVPIIGQAFTLLDVVPVAVLTCNCESKKVLSVAGFNVPTQCPGCKKIFVLQGVESHRDPVTGKKHHNVKLGMAMPAPDPIAEQAKPADQEKVDA